MNPRNCRHSDVEASIAAVVVTFNRNELLTECIDSLVNQTRRVDRIFVIDNASGDGTYEHLLQRGLLSNTTIEYVQMEENLGGAGGFFVGMKRAIEAGYAWVWVMDDDAEPLLTALERLVPWMEQPNVVGLCSMIGDRESNPDFSQLQRGWLESFAGGHIVRGIKPEDLERKASLDITHCSFVGLMVSAEAIRKVGLPKKEFFIHNDDTEFCARLTRIGEILLIADSMVLHKVAGQRGLLLEKRVFGRHVRRPRFEKLWTQYYGHRNLSWMIYRNYAPSTSKLKFILWHAKLILAVIAYDDHKWSRLKFWNSAFIDGIRGVFDNEKPKRLTGHPL